jgi:tRNA U34 5-methylaminomethyl-2-thiouridine-forming methyltransferase MnmC
VAASNLLCESEQVRQQDTHETFEIVTVASGDRSLRSLDHGETFHPVVGPMAEARGLHVAQQRMVERAHENSSQPFVIWDVGLGAAANAIAVLEAFSGRDVNVELHSFDRTIAPLEFALNHAPELGYFEGQKAVVAELLRNSLAKVQGLNWILHLGDFRERVSDPSIPAPGAVMFDPYSPSANPELWNLETFTSIRERVSDEVPCTLTSYSRSTAVRTTLLLAGWFVGRGGATGEKDETTVAASRPELLAQPLEIAWLERVRRSTAPGPLTLAKQTRMGAEIADQLASHPQFTPR